MKTILRVIQKNIKLLVRSKGSALIVIFGPLLLIFLVGLAFDNSNAYSVSVGTYSEKYSDLSTSILNQMNEKGFKVTKFNSENECTEAIKQGTVHTCMVFSKDFEIGKDMNNELIFHIDYSKINLVYMILDTLSDEIKSKSSQVSLDLTNVLLQKIDDTEKEIKEDKGVAVKLTESANKEGSDIKDISAELGKLNLQMDLKDFPVETVVNTTTIMKELATRSTQRALDIITQMQDGLTKVNLTGKARENFDNTLTDAEANMTTFMKKINNQSADLVSLGRQLQNSIDTVKRQVDAAGAARSDVIKEIDDLAKHVDASVKNLLVMQSSFNKIDNNLQSIDIKNAQDIVTPIKTTIKPIETQKTHLNYIFPSLIVLVIMFICILLSSTLVVMEKTSKAYFRNFITPTKDIVFVAGTYLTSMLLLVIQLIVILTVSAFFFKSQLISALGPTILILVLAGTLFTLIGMAIGYLFNSEETATLAAISCGSVFLFMSSVILPIESMPNYVAQVAQYNPFVLSENLLRQAILFHYPLSVLGHNLVIEAGYCVGLFVVIFMVQKVMKKNFVTKYAKRFAPMKQNKKNNLDR